MIVLTGTELSDEQAAQVDAVVRKGDVSRSELLDAIGGPSFSETQPHL